MEAERGRGRLRAAAGRGRGLRGEAGNRRRQISDDTRDILVDHVINHDLTMREAGQRAQPKLSRYSVASIIRTFRLENRYVLNFPH